MHVNTRVISVQLLGFITNKLAHKHIWPKSAVELPTSNSSPNLVLVCAVHMVKVHTELN